MVSIYHAFCWTLLHSLWQGLILAIIAGALIMFTAKSSAEWRYKGLNVLLLLFIITIWITFFIEVQQAVTIDSQTKTTVGQIYADGTVASIVTDYSERFIGYVNENSFLFVVIWFIIFCVKFVNLLSGLARIHRLRHCKTSLPSDYWKERMHELAIILGIRQKILLLESSLVQVPLVIGWLKPVILLPAGIITRLSQEQLEAVLLHELAHIKRKDFLANIVQGFAEVVFFFNPAVLWVSSLIRDERENCCDDMAIGVTKCRTGFVGALVSFQKYNIESKYTVGLRAGSGQLLNRVRRIAYNNNQTLTRLEKSMVSCCFFIICLLLVAFAQSPERIAGSEKDSIGKPDNLYANNIIPNTDSMAVRADTPVNSRNTETAPLKKTYTPLTNIPNTGGPANIEVDNEILLQQIPIIELQTTTKNASTNSASAKKTRPTASVEPSPLKRKQ